MLKMLFGATLFLVVFAVSGGIIKAVDELCKEYENHKFFISFVVGMPAAIIHIFSGLAAVFSVLAAVKILILW